MLADEDGAGLQPPRWRRAASDPVELACQFGIEPAQRLLLQTLGDQTHEQLARKARRRARPVEPAEAGAQFVGAKSRQLSEPGGKASGSLCRRSLARGDRHGVSPPCGRRCGRR